MEHMSLWLPHRWQPREKESLRCLNMQSQRLPGETKNTLWETICSGAAASQHVYWHPARLSNWESYISWRHAMLLPALVTPT